MMNHVPQGGPSNGTSEGNDRWQLIVPETMTRDYLSSEAYYDDAFHLIREGWHIGSVVNPRSLPTGRVDALQQRWRRRRGQAEQPITVIYERLQ